MSIGAKKAVSNVPYAFQTYFTLVNTTKELDEHLSSSKKPALLVVFATW